ncbi:MAG: universal stress protein [Desulfobacterales bacterium]
MFGKILFPVDLSENMYKIQPVVIEMADKFNSEIHCVYCLHVAMYYSHIGLSVAYVADFENQARAEVEKKLKKFTAENFQGRRIHSKILSGRPGDEIVRYIHSENMDLVVMGHSSTGIERALLGSVAAHVVKYSPVPVMVISPGVLKD